MTTKSDLASYVQNRIDDIPNAVSSTVIQEFIENSHIEIENKTGDSFSTSSIPTKYQPILVDMAIVNVLDYMITHNISAGGTLNLSASDISRKIERLQKKIDNEMVNLIRKEGTAVTSEPEETEDY